MFSASHYNTRLSLPVRQAGGGQARGLSRRGFTLIELLVVIAIIRHIGGDVATGSITGKGESKTSGMYEQFEADWVGHQYVC